MIKVLLLFALSAPALSVPEASDLDTLLDYALQNEEGLQDATFLADVEVTHITPTSQPACETDLEEDNCCLTKLKVETMLTCTLAVLQFIGPAARAAVTIFQQLHMQECLMESWQCDPLHVDDNYFVAEFGGCILDKVCGAWTSWCGSWAVSGCSWLAEKFVSLVDATIDATGGFTDWNDETQFSQEEKEDLFDMSSPENMGFSHALQEVGPITGSAIQTKGADKEKAGLLDCFVTPPIACVTREQINNAKVGRRKRKKMIEDGEEAGMDEFQMVKPGPCIAAVNTLKTLVNTIIDAVNGDAELNVMDLCQAVDIVSKLSCCWNCLRNAFVGEREKEKIKTGGALKDLASCAAKICELVMAMQVFKASNTGPCHLYPDPVEEGLYEDTLARTGFFWGQDGSGMCGHGKEDEDLTIEEWACRLESARDCAEFKQIMKDLKAVWDTMQQAAGPGKPDWLADPRLAEWARVLRQKHPALCKITSKHIDALTKYGRWEFPCDMVTDDTRWQEFCEMHTTIYGSSENAPYAMDGYDPEEVGPSTAYVYATGLYNLRCQMKVSAGVCVSIEDCKANGHC